MANNRKQTSKSVATKASQILKDNRYSSKSKSVAGSALAQTKPTKKKYVLHSMGGVNSINQSAHPLLWKIKICLLPQYRKTNNFCIKISIRVADSFEKQS